MKYCLVFVALILLTASSLAQANVIFTLGNNGISSWFISSQSDNVGPLGSGNPNPTLTLLIGTRYDVTIPSSLAHPFQLIAKGPTDTADTVLLSQGSIAGSLETNPGVNWTDNAGTKTVSFTLTQSLANAMSNPALSEVPGYRCAIHTMTMRGNVNLVPEPSTIAILLVGGLGGLLLWRRRS